MHCLNNKRPLYLCLFATVMIAAAAWGVSSNSRPDSNTCIQEHRHLSRFAQCDEKVRIKKTNFLQTQAAIELLIQKRRQTGEISQAYIYFRDLDNGPIFGIRENDKFIPASLLKLPVAVALYEMDEESGDILDQMVQYVEPAVTLRQNFPPKVSAQQNHPYTVRELINLMISYSDNVSYGMLMSYISGMPSGPEKLIATFQDLGMIDPQTSTDASMSARTYSSLFRLLHNATYLNRDNSEAILQALTKSDFAGGLRAGVPKQIEIAHKFGERELDGQPENDRLQLQDCGIVYYPGSPYLLCVSVQGSNWESLSAFIKEVSSMVYTDVEDSQRN